MADLFESNYEYQPSAKVDGCPLDMPSTCQHPRQWFVMRVTYSRELKAQSLLRDAGVRCYIPMRSEHTEEGERYVPAVHNLLFVHTSRQFMNQYKRKMEEVCPLRYMIDRRTGLPMVVRDREMEDFMRVTENAGNDIIYLNHPEGLFAKGTPVEISAGPLKGVKGCVLRIRRDRKVVLQIAGVVAVAVNGIPMEHCRIIPGIED